MEGEPTIPLKGVNDVRFRSPSLLAARFPPKVAF
jgi:hypothetical protein